MFRLLPSVDAWQVVVLDKYLGECVNEKVKLSLIPTAFGDAEVKFRCEYEVHLPGGQVRAESLAVSDLTQG